MMDMGKMKSAFLRKKPTLLFSRHDFVSKSGVKIPGFSPAWLLSETAGVPAPP